MTMTDVGELSNLGPSGNPSHGQIHLMTSGTTGRPKIAVHTLESLVARIRATTKVPGSQHNGWLLTYQATAFAGLQVILTAALSGGSLVVTKQRSPADFFGVAERHGVTHISGTPTFWRSFLLVAPPGSLAELRQITLGGEAIDQPTLDRLRTTFPNAHITYIYASTEAGVVCSVTTEKKTFRRIGWNRSCRVSG
jgi:acyl-CoA synthetase (AMP-forming)/AMP-acid ligase II